MWNWTSFVSGETTGWHFQSHFSVKFALNGGSPIIANYDGSSASSCTEASQGILQAINTAAHEQIVALSPSGWTVPDLIGSGGWILFENNDQTDTDLYWGLSGNTGTGFLAVFIPINLTLIPQGGLSGSVDFATMVGVTSPTTYHSCGYYGVD